MRYDMARQFDMSKAVGREIDENQVVTFDIYMELGIKKKNNIFDRMAH